MENTKAEIKAHDYFIYKGNVFECLGRDNGLVWYDDHKRGDCADLIYADEGDCHYVEGNICPYCENDDFIVCSKCKSTGRIAPLPSSSPNSERCLTCGKDDNDVCSDSFHILSIPSQPLKSLQDFETESHNWNAYEKGGDKNRAFREGFIVGAKYASQKSEWIKWEDPHNRVVDNHQASEIVLKFDDGSACFFDGNWPSDGIVTHFLIIPSPPKD